MGELDDQLRRLGEARAAEVAPTAAIDVIAAPRRRLQLAWWLSAAAAVVVLAGLGAVLLWSDDDNPDGDVADSTTSTTSTEPAPPTTSTPGTRAVGTAVFGVELDIPPEWTYDTNDTDGSERWSGDSGFVALFARADESGLDALAEQVANHRLRPFGTEPTIEEISVAGTSARLIMPAADATPLDGFAFGEVLVRAPEPIELGGDTYNVVSLRADVDHIRAVAASVTWIEPSGPPPTGDLSPDDRYDAVAATPTGVTLRHADDPMELDHIVFEPVALAFLINQESGPTLVYQLAEQGDVYPPWPAGPINVMTPAGITTIDTEEAFTQLQLHDAAILDGRPTVLATRRTSGATPETTEERLLLIDIESGERTDLGTVGGWESGVSDARLTDGSVVLLLSAEGFTWIEVLEYDGTSRWESEQTFDRSRSVAVSGESVLDLQPGFSDDLEPTLGWSSLDIRTGETAQRAIARTPAHRRPRRSPPASAHRATSAGRHALPLRPDERGAVRSSIRSSRWSRPEEGFTEGVVTRARPLAHP